MVDKVEKIWMDGEFVDWDDARVHVLSHTLHYGYGVFEGLRCYKCADGRSAIFRLDEHARRLYDSAKIIGLDIPYPPEVLKEAMKEALRVNGMDEGYLRPMVMLGLGAMGLFPKDNETHTIVAAWRWGAYLGDEGLNNGIRVQISSFTRSIVNAQMTRAKVCGNYVNSIMAKKAAVADGFDEAIMLDAQGYVAEGSGENIFIVRDGVIQTPPLTSMLAGITRASALTIAEDLGYKVELRLLTRDDLYIADEAFMVGTAAEITPIRSCDHCAVGSGKPGPVTKSLQEVFFKAVRGEDKRYESWLSHL